MSKAQDIADRIVGVYNEDDPQKRVEKIAAVWTPTGEHFGGFQAQGYAALAEGIQGSHDNVLVKNGWKWRAYNSRMREDVVFFMFDGVSQATGDVQALGSAVLILADDGRVEKDYTFMLDSRYANGDKQGS